MSKFAWVTLTTNDTYSLGALVLAHSLRRAGTVHQLAVLITPGVSESMRAKLKDVYNVVQEVNVMDSQDAANLALLARPELGITFTKLHCWRLVQFEKCVFLDSDTLILQNCDELFEREEFSAAPDVSWPDCFNSGVFVYKPSQATYDKIVEFATKNGSFDGGDQGLLNQYFADWATSDIKKRLPFLYNVTAYASYCYLPAFKQFRDKIKILHFAGKMKPWLIPFNSQSKTASVPSDYSHANDLIQLWWNIFFDNVHAQLNTNMLTLLQECKEQDNEDSSYIEESIKNKPKKEERYSCPTLMPWKNNYDNIKEQELRERQRREQEQQQNEYHNNINNCQYKQQVDNFYAHSPIKFHDPWEDYYRKQENEDELQRKKEEVQRIITPEPREVNNDNNNTECQQHYSPVQSQNERNSDNFTQEQPQHMLREDHNCNSQNFTQEPETRGGGDGHNHHDYNSQCFTREPEHKPVENEHDRTCHIESHERVLFPPQREEHNPVADQTPHQNQSDHLQNNEECECQSKLETENITSALSNYDSSEINSKHIDTDNEIKTDNNSDNKSATRPDEISEEPPATPSLSAVQSAHDAQLVATPNKEDTHSHTHSSGEEAGLAAALSQLRLGEERTPEQEAYEHLMRRQCWESGQVDYLGRDSFDNIWKRITQTLEAKPADDDKTEMLTSADIEDGKVEYDEKTGVKVEYIKIDGGYQVKTTTPQPNGGWKASTQTFYDPKPVTEEDMKKQMEMKKTIKTRLNKEIRIDERTTMLTREIEGGYEEVYTTVNEDGSKSIKTKTFFDAVPEGTPFPDAAQHKPAPKQPGSKKTIVRKSSVESTDSTDSRKMVQKNSRNTSTIEESRRVTQNYEMTENNRTVRKNSLQTEQTIKSITSSNATDGSDNKKKKVTKKVSKTQAPPPPADFVQNDTTSVSTKHVPGGVEYVYTTELESGKTITTSKTVYEEEECELTEEEIRAYKKTLKDAEKHKNVTTTKKLKSESGTKKVVPSENPGDVTTVETIKIQGGTEYHYTTVTPEGIVKKAVKTVYDPVPSSNPEDTEEEEIIEEYEEEIIEPGEKNIRTIETIKSLPQQFQEEVTITHEKKEKKTKKTMMMVSQ